MPLLGYELKGNLVKIQSCSRNCNLSSQKGMLNIKLQVTGKNFREDQY
jgi:hypothetical protein